MEHDAPIGALAGQRPRRCPTCGTPYPDGGGGLGCPVCQFRRLLEPDAVGDNEGWFDHYELETAKSGSFDELGRGAMGITYRALDTVLEHAVALKVIDARIASHPEARERFLREARAAARLRHPNVASVFYYGVRKSDGQCFYAMELVEGETLEARLRRAGPLPTTLALEVTVQLARALAAVEAQGLVHRDLKPSNLMLTFGPELTVKLIDFGLARAAVAGEADVTHGGFVGTPAFASPEQCAGGEVDVRSDLYSLGVMLWEMVTGHGPFRGSPAEVMHQHQHAPLPLDQIEGIPHPVVVLIEALLEKDPRRRFQTPAELLKVMPAIREAVDEGHTTTRQSLQQMPHRGSYALGLKPPKRLEPERISIALPITGSDNYDRENDIAFLNDAWGNPNINVVTIVARAGVGKSTLVNHWLDRMAAEHYRSAQFVFAWSFRKSSSWNTSSAEDFLQAALAWFGDPDPRIGTA